MIRIAIVEDDPPTLARFERAIEGAPDMAVAGTAASYVEGALLVDRDGYDVLLCDLGLPDGSGIDLIRRAVLRNSAVDVLVMTMFADQRKVLDSIRAGARGYLLKDEPVEDCVEAIREIQRGGSPISPIIARQLLDRLQPQPMKGDSALSDRELEVLNMLARGFSNAESAEMLGLSALTVGSHVKSIYRKLEVNSRAEALFEASTLGLLDRR